MMYTQSALYFWLISRVADLIYLCVFLLNVAVSLLMPMHHVSAKFSALILFSVHVIHFIVEIVNILHTNWPVVQYLVPLSNLVQRIWGWCGGVLLGIMLDPNTFTPHRLYQYIGGGFFLIHLTNLSILWCIFWSVQFNQLGLCYLPFRLGCHLNVGDFPPHVWWATLSIIVFFVPFKKSGIFSSPSIIMDKSCCLS